MISRGGQLSFLLSATEEAARKRSIMKERGAVAASSEALSFPALWRSPVAGAQARKGENHVKPTDCS
jgi:hypothetical protein